MVTLALVAVSAAPARAQVTGGGGSSIGVVAGFNIVKIAFDPSVSAVLEDEIGFENASSGGVNGIAAGISFEVPLGRPRLRIEGLFSQGGGKFGAELNDGAVIPGGVGGPRGNGVPAFSFESKVKLNTLEIPVVIVIPLGVDDKIRVLGGGFLAFNLSQKETFTQSFAGDSEEVDIEGDEQTDLKKSSFGIALGAEVRVAPRIGVGGRFNLGLTNIREGDDLPFDSVKFRTIRVYVVFDIK